MDTLLDVLKEAKGQQSTQYFPLDADIYMRELTTGYYTRLYVVEGATSYTLTSIDNTLMSIGKGVRNTMLKLSCPVDNVHHEYDILLPPENFQSYAKRYYGDKVKTYVLNDDVIKGQTTVDEYTYSVVLYADIDRIYRIYRARR